MKTIFYTIPSKIAFLFLPMLLLSVHAAFAQPHWVFSTHAHFVYTILDKDSNEISFRDNPDYSIIVNDTEYVAPDIPYDYFKTVEDIMDSLVITRDFEKHIEINDFRLSLYRPSLHGRNYYEDITIKHQNEFMHIYQSTTWRVLQFIPGYYYFPRWYKEVTIKIPTLNSNLRFNNLKQSNFTIPAAIYAHLPTAHTSKLRSKLEDQAERHIAEQFSKDHFTVQKRIDKKYRYYRKNTTYKVPDYKNFKIENKNKIVFKNGAEPLHIEQDMTPNYCCIGINDHNYHLLENGSEIYFLKDDVYGLIGYISFDAGSSWYLYPFYEIRYNYCSSEINESGEVEIIFYDVMSKKRKKFVYKFELINKQ